MSVNCLPVTLLSSLAPIQVPGLALLFPCSMARFGFAGFYTAVKLILELQLPWLLRSIS